MKRIVAAILLISISIFILTACEDSSSNIGDIEKSERQDVKNPQAGGSVNLGTVYPLNLDPLMWQNDETKAYLSLIFDGLVKIDSQGMVQPSLAQNWTISENGKTLTFNLRKDVKWHNGENFTSDDVKETFDKMKELKKLNREEFPELDYVQGYEAPDQYTFTVYLNQEYSGFLYYMDRAILSKSYLETLEEAQPQDMESETIDIIGTGPFKVIDRTYETITLKRNDDYFDKTPYLERINIKIYPNKLSMQQAFEEGNLDILTIDSNDWNIFQNMEHAYLIQYPYRYFEFIALNLTNPLFKDVNVRRAILSGIDRDKILQEATLGRGIIVDGPILPYSWAHNSQIQQFLYDKKEALQKLEQAGWKDEDGDEILEKTISGKKQKFEFELLVNADNGTRYKIAAHIQDDLKDLGISVNLVNLSWDELKKKVMNKNYDAAIMGLKLTPNPDLRFMFASSEIGKGYNFASYSNAELDDVLNRACEFSEETKELLFKAQEIISKDLPYLFLYSPNKIVAINKRLNDVKPDSINIFNNICNWWVEQ